MNEIISSSGTIIIPHTLITYGSENPFKSAATKCSPLSIVTSKKSSVRKTSSSVVEDDDDFPKENPRRFDSFIFYNAPKQENSVKLLK